MRTRAAALLLTVCAMASALPSALAADMKKVLRVSLGDITSLDPQQGTDLRSTRIATHIFEGLYQFDYLATPARVIPNTAEALPQFSDGGRTWTIRLRLIE
jgi:oligopeptide transport system substrate-binding protein